MTAKLLPTESGPRGEHTELGQRALVSAEIALDALASIGALLDDDCDETRVALYNPRATVAAIRNVLEQAQTELTRWHERRPAAALDRLYEHYRKLGEAQLAMAKSLTNGGQS